MDINELKRVAAHLRECLEQCGDLFDPGTPQSKLFAESARNVAQLQESLQTAKPQPKPTDNSKPAPATLPKGVY